MTECFTWPPPKRKKPLFLAVPASTLSTEDSLLLKTLKAGYIARAAALYRVDRILVYRDKNTTPKDYRTLRIILEYLSVPPYLRKKVFPLLPELRHIGIVPPVQPPSHIIPKYLRKGLILEGLVEKCEKGQCIVYLGELGYGKIRKYVKPGKLLTVEIIEAGEEILLKQTRPAHYWRYYVETYTSLHQIISKYGATSIIIGTSRLGECDKAEIKRRVSLLGKTKKRAILVFGGPKGHVWDETGKEVFHIIINTLSWQGSKTVRTEEAIMSSLNYLLDILV